MSRNSCVMKSPLSSGLFCHFAPKGISNALIFLIFCRKTQGPGLSRRHTLAMTLIMAAFCKPIHFGSWFSESAIQSWPYVGESHEQNHPTPIASADANLQGNWVSEAKEMVSLTKEVCGGWEKDFLLAVIVPDTNVWYMTFVGGSWETFHYLPVAFWSWLYSAVRRGETEWAAHFSSLTSVLHLWFLMLRQQRGVLNSGSWSIKWYRKKKKPRQIALFSRHWFLFFLSLSWPLNLSPC